MHENIENIDRYDYKIEVYSDQLGRMVYPQERLKESIKIKNFFNKGIELYIDKKQDKITILCSVLAHKVSERDNGYYIVYLDLYDQNVFSRFKREATKILETLGLGLRTSLSIENTIFDNIDSNVLDTLPSVLLNKDLILNAVSNQEYLEYMAGNINETLTFCKEMLKGITNIVICVSSKENKSGNINIILVNNPEMRLTPTEATKQIIDRMIADNRKKIEDSARMKKSEGFRLIKDAVYLYMEANHDITSIKKDINSSINEMFNSINQQAGQSPTSIPTSMSNYESQVVKHNYHPLAYYDNQDNLDNEYITMKVLYLIIIIIFALVVVVAIFFPDYIRDIVEKLFPSAVPEGATSPLTTPTPVQTPTPTPTPTNDAPIIPIVTGSKL